MEQLRDPLWAAATAGAITASYMYITLPRIDGQLRNSQWMKPAFLVALLVYMIVSAGIGGKEELLTQSF